MEPIRLVVLAALIPTIDTALPLTPESAQLRAALLRPGDSSSAVERVLGLRMHCWISSGSAGENWFSTYHDPKTGHSVTVHYRKTRDTCKLRLQEVEIKR